MTASTPPPTPTPTPTPTSFAGSFQMMFGMFVVLALLFGITWMLKKYGPVKSGNSTTVKIVGGISVGNRERIVVVEVADQWIVVGVAPGRVSTLSTMPKQDGVVTVAADTKPPQKNFAAWLKQTIDKRNAG
ncbi:MAG: flagellar biosynthetic protein FliO [Herminiimonas sp.]|nr:flagellar biosynthetic protein FliO [Herminiimonas sp.]